MREQVNEVVCTNGKQTTQALWGSDSLLTRHHRRRVASRSVLSVRALLWVGVSHTHPSKPPHMQSIWSLVKVVSSLRRISDQPKAKDVYLTKTAVQGRCLSVGTHPKQRMCLHHPC